MFAVWRRRASYPGSDPAALVQSQGRLRAPIASGRQSASFNFPVKSQKDHIIEGRFHTAWVIFRTSADAAGYPLYPEREATSEKPLGKFWREIFSVETRIVSQLTGRADKANTRTGPLLSPLGCEVKQVSLSSRA